MKFTNVGKDKAQYYKIKCTVCGKISPTIKIPDKGMKMICPKCNVRFIVLDYPKYNQVNDTWLIKRAVMKPYPEWLVLLYNQRYRI